MLLLTSLTSPRADWSIELTMSSDAPRKKKACRNPDNVIPGIRQFRAKLGSDVTV